MICALKQRSQAGIFLEVLTLEVAVAVEEHIDKFKKLINIAQKESRRTDQLLFVAILN